MKQYAVGIDLGTSNTVVAYIERASDEIRVFEIEQLVGPGEVAARPLLPSVRYHLAAGELAAGDLALPWKPGDTASDECAIVGSLARDLGAQVPGRLVASAKSWLSHPAVDRWAPILPWGAGEDVAKVSPVAASASYLAHVRAAWNARFPHAPLEQQELVLTVPASFDEAARALTLEAARLAGLPQLHLVEEPQAAFYDWLFRHRQQLDMELSGTRLVLVCDVGGGTSDFTLIQVELTDGAPRLTRIGVSDHLMLGGDNMDLALAHFVENRIAETASRLTASRLAQLVQRCRVAKERLLAPDAPERTTVTLLGGGSRLIGGAASVELTREEVGRIIVEGFFPKVAADEPARRVRSGIVEFGLPYASDPAVTRHIAAFLRQHAAASRQALGAADDQTLPVPDTLLYNGGVFRAAPLAARLEATLGAWRGSPLRVLHNDNPDVAVARGAVAYALARGGLAPRIGGGSPRSYFLLLEDDQASRRGICLLPRGTEEGREVRVENRTFALRLGQPVRFHLASSIADTPYVPGELSELAEGTFIRLPPLTTVVSARGERGSKEIPVGVTTQLTEVGTLELYCTATGDTAQKWRLEFQLRGEEAPVPENQPLHPRLGEARDRIERVYGARSQAVDAKEVRQLRPQLEHLLGPRDTWTTPLLRELFAQLWERARKRRRSADHERLWFNLAGYCLRPGFGYPLDEWRVEQLWSLFEAGLQHASASQIWSEWWTLWRRVAGGLDEQAQLRLLDDIAYYLQPEGTGRYARPGGPERGALEDMVRLAASLERVPVARKTELGDWLLGRMRKSPSQAPQSLWAIGRIGAREPFYGSAHQVVPAETAVRWLEEILALDWKKAEAAAFAATSLARMTGDRTRDLPPEVRERVIQRLTTSGASKIWISLLRQKLELEAADERRVFGESLPAGLKLIA